MSSMLNLQQLRSQQPTKDRQNSGLISPFSQILPTNKGGSKVRPVSSIQSQLISIDGTPGGKTPGTRKNTGSKQRKKEETNFQSLATLTQHETMNIDEEVEEGAMVLEAEAKRIREN